MSDDPGPEITRRQLLAGSAAVLAVGLVGCSSDDGGGIDAGTMTSAGDPATTRPAPELSGDPFTLGVASGDPRSDSVVLWTRLAPEPLAADGLGGMPDEEVDVRWEVATDDAFADVVAEGVAVASPDHAHAVHAVVEGLAAGATLHYRFTVGDATSPVGRTRTLPDGSPEEFALAVVNCQWFETGTYAAFTHLAAEDVDLVLHLGDYVYEYPGGVAGIAGRTTLPDKVLETLADYRLRYASYRVDPDLQAVHARFPWILTWDDHEVSNNYMGDVLAPDTFGVADAAERRAAAYRAWWEHLPVRWDPPEGDELAIHQHVDVGDLARLYVLDQRQHSDVPPCRDEVASDFGDCAARAEDRARLGDEQEAWLSEALTSSPATWNLLGNPVVLAGVDGGNDADGAAYYLDTWDGFPTARQRLIDQLATVDNPVVLTGDYHAGMVLDVDARPFEDRTLVAPEFMAPPISSPLFPQDVSARTPQLRQQINGHGYMLVGVARDELAVAFRVLADVQDPESPITTQAAWRVVAGSPEPTPL